MRVFIGNISFSATEGDLHEFFSEHGLTPEKIELLIDRDTNRPRGFGLATFGSAEEANSAIDAMNGQDFMGRTLNVNEARPREDHRSATRGRR